MWNFRQKTLNVFSTGLFIVLDENIPGVLPVKITKHQPLPAVPYDIPVFYREKAALHLASPPRVSKITLPPRDGFIFRIGNLCVGDIKRVEAACLEFLASNRRI